MVDANKLAKELLPKLDELHNLVAEIRSIVEKYTGEPLKRYSLPGIQSSMVRRSYNFGYKEKIWTSKDNLYTLKKKYRTIVKNFIENDGELK